MKKKPAKVDGLQTYSIKEKVAELRDSNGISTENHIQMTNRLLAAAAQGIHGTPGKRKGEAR